MKLFRKLYQREEGFTLIELLIVIAILGILAGIAVPRITGARDEAAKASLKSTATTIRNSMENFYAIEGNYPLVTAGQAVSTSNPDFTASTSGTTISIDVSGADGLTVVSTEGTTTGTTGGDPSTSYNFVISDGDWEIPITSTSGVGAITVASP